MWSRTQKLGQQLRFFGRDVRGGVTVEFVLWVPIFIGIILLAADASVAFTRQSTMLDVSQNTARILARHGMTIDEALVYASAQSEFAGHKPAVDIQLSDNEVTVLISADSRVMAPFGILAPALGDTVSVKVRHGLEPI